VTSKAKSEKGRGAGREAPVSKTRGTEVVGTESEGASTAGAKELTVAVEATSVGATEVVEVIAVVASPMRTSNQ